MDEQSGFIFTFLNGKVLLGAPPEIVWGLVVTLELAVLVVATGLMLGLVAAVLRLRGWRLQAERLKRRIDGRTIPVPG